MTKLDAAEHFADALRNFLSKMDAGLFVDVYESDELEGRYGPQPKVILEMSGFDLHGTGEVRTEFGWVDLREYGLDQDVLDRYTFEAHNASTICVYD